MNNLLIHLKNPNLLCIKGMTTELGYNTERIRLNNLKECEDWLRDSSKNSVKFIVRVNEKTDETISKLITRHNINEN